MTTQVARSAWTALFDRLETLFAPLGLLAADGERAAARFGALGWDLAAAAGGDPARLLAALDELHGALSGALAQAREAGGAPGDEAPEKRVPATGARLGELLAELRARLSGATAENVPAEAAAALGVDLLRGLVVERLAQDDPELHQLAGLLGLVTDEQAAPLSTGDGPLARRPVQRPVLCPERLGELVEDPLRVLAGPGPASSFGELAASTAERLRALDAAAGAEPSAGRSLRLDADGIALFEGAERTGGGTGGELPLELALALDDQLVPRIAPFGGGWHLAWPHAERRAAPAVLFEEGGFTLTSAGADGRHPDAAGISISRPEGSAQLAVAGPLRVELPSGVARAGDGGRLTLAGTARFAGGAGGAATLALSRLSARHPRVELVGGPVLHEAEVELEGLAFPLPPVVPPPYRLSIRGLLELGGARLPVHATYDGSGFDLVSLAACDLGGGVQLAPLELAPVLRLRVESRDESGALRAELAGGLAIPQAGGSAVVPLTGAVELETRAGGLAVVGCDVTSKLRERWQLTLPGRIRMRAVWVQLRHAGDGFEASLGGRIQVGEGEIELHRAILRYPDPGDPRRVEITGEGTAGAVELFGAAEFLEARVLLHASTVNGSGTLRVVEAAAGLFPLAAPPRGAQRRDRYELFLEDLAGSFHFGADGFSLTCTGGRLILPEAFDAGAGRAALDVGAAASPLVLGYHPAAHPPYSFSGTLEVADVCVDLSAEGERDAPTAQIDAARLVFAKDDLPRVAEARGRIAIPLPGARRAEVPFDEFTWELADLPAGAVTLERDLEIELGAGFALRVLSASPASGRRTLMEVGRDAAGFARFAFDGTLELAIPPDLLARVQLDPEGAPSGAGEPIRLRAEARFALPTRPGAELELGELALETGGCFRLGSREAGLVVRGEDEAAGAHLRAVGLAAALIASPGDPFYLALEGAVEFAAPGPLLALEEARFLFDGAGAGEPVTFPPPTFRIEPGATPLFRGLPVELIRARLGFADATLELPARLAPANLAFELEAELAPPLGDGDCRARLHEIGVELERGQPRIALGAARLAVDGLEAHPGLVLAGELRVGELHALPARPEELVFAGALAGRLSGADVTCRVAFHPQRPIGLVLETAHNCSNVPVDESGFLMECASGGLLLFEDQEDPAEPLRAIELDVDGRPLLLWRSAGDPPRLDPNGPTLLLRGTLTPAGRPSALALAGELRVEAGDTARASGELTLHGVPIGFANGVLDAAADEEGVEARFSGFLDFAVGGLSAGDALFDLVLPEHDRALVAAVAARSGRALRRGASATVRAALGSAAEEAPTVTALRGLVERSSFEGALAFLGRLAALAAREDEPGPAARLHEAVLEDLAELCEPLLEIRGVVLPRWYGMRLTPEKVELRARAAGGRLVGGCSVSPRAAIEPALPGGGCLPASDSGVLALELPLDAAHTTADEGPDGDGFERAVRTLRCRMALELSPFGLHLAEARARLVPIRADLIEDPGRPWPAAPDELDGALPSRPQLLTAAGGAGGPLGDPEWDGALAGLSVPGRESPAGLSFERDYFPGGGLVGAGMLELPAALADGLDQALVARALDADAAPRARLRALRTILATSRAEVTTRGPVGFYAPAPHPRALGLDHAGALRARVADLARVEEATVEQPGAFFAGWLSGRLLGVAIENAEVATDPRASAGAGGGLEVRALAPAGSWIAALRPGAPLSFSIRRAPALPMVALLRLLERVARRPPRGERQVTALLAPLRAELAERRAALFAAAGLAAGELPDERALDGDQRALAQLEAELTSLARTLTRARGERGERALADFLSSALTRALPRVSLHADLGAVELPAPLSEVLGFPAGDARVEAYSPLYQAAPSDGSTARPAERARRLGGVVLRGDVALCASMGLALRVSEAELEVDAAAGGFARLAADFELESLSLPFGLPALSAARVRLRTGADDGGPRLSPGDLVVTGWLESREAELGLARVDGEPALRGAVEHAVRLQNVDLGPVHVPGSELRLADRIRLETDFRGVFDLDLCTGRPTATVTGEFDWNGWSWGIPELVLDAPHDRPHALRARLVAHLRAHTAEILAEAFDDLDFWLEAVRSGAIQLDEQGAPAIARVFAARGRPLVEVAGVLRRAGFGLDETASALAASAGREAIVSVTRALAEAWGADALDEVAAALRTAWGERALPAAAGALVATWGVEALSEVARALRRAYGDARLDAIAAALKEARGAERIVEVSAALRASFGAGRLAAITAALRNAWGADRAPEVARALRASWGADALPRVARALKAAWGADEIDEVARALRRAWGADHLVAVTDALRRTWGAGALAEVAGALRAAWGASRLDAVAAALERAWGAERLDEIAVALHAAWGERSTARTLARALQDVWGARALERIARALRRALGDGSLEAVARALKQAWGAERLPLIATALRDAWGAERRDEIALALRRAGYELDEIAGVLRTRFSGIERAERLTALAAAGFAWEEVARVGAEAYRMRAGELAEWSKGVCGHSAPQIAARLLELGSEPEEVAWALGATGFSAAGVGRALQAGAADDPRKAAGLLWSAGFEPQDVAQALHEVFECDPGSAARALKAGGFEPREIAAGLRAAYTEEAAEAARALRAAGLELREVAPALRGLFARKPEELAAALRAAEFEPPEVGRALREGFTRDATRAARSLRRAGFEPTEVAQALQGVYPGGAKGTARALKSARFEAEEIRAALTAGIGASETAADSIVASLFRK